MEREIITISENGVVAMPTAPVWMTMQEMADLFMVFCYDIRKAVRTIIRAMSYWKKKRNGTSDRTTEHVTRCTALKW